VVLHANGKWAREAPRGSHVVFQRGDDGGRLSLRVDLALGELGGDGGLLHHHAEGGGDVLVVEGGLSVEHDGVLEESTGEGRDEVEVEVAAVLGVKRGGGSGDFVLCDEEGEGAEGEEGGEGGEGEAGGGEGRERVGDRRAGHALGKGGGEDHCEQAGEVGGGGGGGIGRFGRELD